MRYILKRKADGKFYRGRDGCPRWTDKIEQSFLFKSPATAANGRTWSRNVKCDCVFKPGLYHSQKKCKPTCARRVECKRLFNENYEVLKIQIVVIP